MLKGAIIFAIGAGAGLAVGAVGGFIVGAFIAEDIDRGSTIGRVTAT